MFCLHPNMQPYSQRFSPMRLPGVIVQGEVDVQHLLKESAMLVTDYSSVGFDFSFLASRSSTTSSTAALPRPEGRTWTSTMSFPGRLA